MNIIAFSGYARSGKDAAADVLVKEFGFTKLAFADKLREFLYALNPICGRDSDYSDTPLIYLRDVIDEYGWNGYKSTEHSYEIRRLIQRCGTDAGRNVLGSDTWVNATFKDVPDDAKIVLSDVRFPNEAQAIKDRGGKIIRINRPDVGPLSDSDGIVHESETGLDNWPFDYSLWNSHSLERYRYDIASLMMGEWP